MKYKTMFQTCVYTYRIDFCRSYPKLRAKRFCCVSLDDFKVSLIISVLFLGFSHHFDDSGRSTEPHNLSHAFVAVVVVVIIIIVVAVHFW